MAPVKVGNVWQDDALGRFYELEPMVTNTGRRRYQVTGTNVEFEYAAAPANQYFDATTGTACTIAAIRAKLGRMSTGLSALGEFHAKGNQPDNQHVTADGPQLFAEYYQLLKLGLGDQAQLMYEPVLRGVPWVITPLGQQYHLTALEELAMWVYSQPNKNVQMVGDQVNPTYMFSHPRWGLHGDGWSALSSALSKLPTLGDLGLGRLPLYRIERADSKLMAYLKSHPNTETYIYHGLQTNSAPTTHVWPGPNNTAWSAEIGQQPHYASASVAPSSHSWSAKAYQGGMLKLLSSSAQFINPWGGMGIVDGGELLIPPGTITYFDGHPITEPWMGTNVMMYVLAEVSGQRKPNVPLIDDYSGRPVT